MFLCYIQSQLAQLVSDKWNGIQGNGRTHFQAYFFQLEQHWGDGLIPVILQGQECVHAVSWRFYMLY